MEEIKKYNEIDVCYNDICHIIEQGQKAVYTATDGIAVVTYWNVGRRIVEEELHGEKRAQYGMRLIANLSARLIPLYGSNYSKRNLDYFRQFYLCFKDFEIVNARVHNLKWSHFKRLLSVDDRGGTAPRDRATEAFLP